MDKKTERAGQIIAYIIGVPLCLYYFGLQFIVVALLIGGVMVWEWVGEAPVRRMKRSGELPRDWTPYPKPSFLASDDRDK